LWSELVGVQGFAACFVPVLAGSGMFGRYLYGRLAIPLMPLFRSWLTTHIALTGILYVSGVMHLIIAVGLRYVSAA